MRIQITSNEQSMEGYFWASPQNKEFHGNYQKLNDYCYAGQAIEIYGPQALNLVKYNELIETLTSWIKLLQKGGKIIVGGVDTYLLSKFVISRNLSLSELNDLVYNSSYSSCVACGEIKTILNKLNIEIDKILMDDCEYRFVIEGTKR